MIPSSFSRRLAIIYTAAQKSISATFDSDIEIITPELDAGNIALRNLATTRTIVEAHQGQLFCGKSVVGRCAVYD
jgi:hypothetical protein